MPLLSLVDVSVAYGAEVVVAGVSVTLEPRDRLALVGANGSGKSSLLRIISGEAEPSSGSVERAAALRVAHLPQDAPEPVASTVLDEVLASRHDLVRMHGELVALEQRMSANPPDLDAVMAAYGALQHTYADAGGYDLESRAREALGGLGLDEGLQQRDPRQLSGGQKRRLELAKLLLAGADLLLIDEPTNHLDLASIEWLEEYMRGVRTTFVLVSHDRRFLDGVCTSVLELSGGTAETYPGSYTQYTRLRTERRARRQKEYETQAAHIAHQEDFIRRYKAGQRAREARGRQKQLDRLERVTPPPRDRRPHLRFTPAPASQVLLKATDLVVGYGTSPVLRAGSFTIAPGERVAIVGANGSGKSTLLHTLAGELQPLRGRLNRGPRTELGLYRQDLGRSATPEPDTTVVEALGEGHAISVERARTVLGALLFSGDDAVKHLADLSGGEMARLRLGRLALEPSNLLLLDEPTNHLDLPAQEVLEEALQGFAGAIILVTHDRALIDAVATHTWGIEDGGLRRVIGGYTDLLRARQRERRPPPGRADSATGPRRGAAAPPPAHSVTGSRRPAAANAPGGGAGVRRLESEIAAVEAELAAVRTALLDPSTFADPDRGAAVGRDHDRLSGALAELYERWAEVAG
ncbi:MAG: ABC-F family ATP-binding cassette domain-containing protein [Candidatus Dormibacteria bacterium]